MYIEIVKPYQSSGQRIITFDNTTITLQEDEVNDLFERLDGELHYGSTREDSQKLVEGLESEIEDLENELQQYQEEAENILNGM